MGGEAIQPRCHQAAAQPTFVQIWWSDEGPTAVFLALLRFSVAHLGDSEDKMSHGAGEGSTDGGGSCDREGWQGCSLFKHASFNEDEFVCEHFYFYSHKLIFITSLWFVMKMSFLIP